MATTKRPTKTSPSARKAAPATATKAGRTAPAKATKATAKAAPPKKSAATSSSATKKSATKPAVSCRQVVHLDQARRSQEGGVQADPCHRFVGGDRRRGRSELPAPRGHTKDGIAYTRDFDAKFLKSQRDLLSAERKALVGQADRLEDEANSLIEDGEMGDVQFDDESGEGDTMVVERERDLALSAQARQIVADIDAALDRMTIGTYGYSLVSGKPIPRERLEALPWATELVEEKVGGIGRR